MLLPTSIVPFAFFSAVRASGLDIRSSQNANTLNQLSLSSTCLRKDVFPQELEVRHASNVCTYNHGHDHHDHHHAKQGQNGTSSYEPHPNDPWEIYPTCSTNSSLQFCVFTSTSFYSGRGISIITKPSTARLISTLPAFNAENNIPASSLSENDFREPPFYVASIPGRGMGLIANRTIHRGELIKAHPAIALFHNTAVDKSLSSYSCLEPLMRLSVDQLPSHTRASFFSMAAHNESEEPYIERIYTNTFGEDLFGHEHSIVVPETARMNHDCRPNAMYYFDTQLLVHYTHASRTIYAGEEITITYIDPLQTRLRRKDAIKRSWGFDCSCSLCSMGKEGVRESNRRIGLILELNKEFEKTDDRRRVVGGTPQIAEVLISLYEQERLWASISDAYRSAALSYAAVGKEWEALKWGMKAVEAGLIHDGPRDDGLKDMKALVEGVEEHWSWGVNLEGLKKEVEKDEGSGE